MNDLLIVVDYQNDFVDGTLGFEEAKEIEGYIAELIKKFESEGNDVIFTLDTHEHDYLETEEGKNLPVKHCISGTKGHELYGSIKDLVGDHIVIEKETFGSIELVLRLSEKLYNNITLVGLVSNMCVLSNAIVAKTTQPNAHIIVDSKGSRSFDKELEQKGYDILKALHVEII